MEWTLAGVVLVESCFPRGTGYAEVPVFFDGIKDDRGKTLIIKHFTVVFFPIFCGAANKSGCGMIFLQSAAVALGGALFRVRG
jgi:hypothetical protein